MKSSRIKITAVLLTAAFAFAGCGEKFYTMTPEEEGAVVSYASQIVAKYNTYQQDGEMFVMQEDLEEKEQQEQEEVQPDDLSTESQPLEELPDDTSATEVQETDPSPETNEEAGNSENITTIREALGLGDIQADFVDSSLCTTYEKSDVYAVDASAGRQLIVLKVNLTNQTKQDTNVDILHTKPSFQVIINETEKAMAQTTILPNDLSTYQGNIAAGESVETVLLFEISQEIQEITGLQLQIIVDDTRYMVNL